MLVSWYIRKQLEKLPPTLRGSVKNPEDWLRIANIRTVILTSADFLYLGKPVIAQYFAVQDQTFETKQTILAIAGSLASKTSNPYFQAIAVAARESNLALREVDVDLLGDEGVSGKLERTQYVLGSEEIMRQDDIELGVTSQTLMQRLELEGKEVVFLAQKQPKRLLGIFACEQPLSTEVAQSIVLLRKQGVELLLLTKQKTRIAKAIGLASDIHLVHSELSTEQKNQLTITLASSTVCPVFIVKHHSPSIPTSSLQITVGTYSDANLSLENLTQLSTLITQAQTLREKVQRTLFWCKV